MHLPFNRPRLNKSQTRVIEGYGVLQPRIGMSHEAAAKSRTFAALWSGDPGIDAYAFAVSDAFRTASAKEFLPGKGSLMSMSFIKYSGKDSGKQSIES